MASDATILNLYEISHDQPVVDQPQSFVALTPTDPQQHLVGPSGSLPVGAVEQQWMPNPPGGNCPPGLEYLTELGEILVHQTMEDIEKVSCLGTNKKYVVKNSLGQKIFSTAEDSVCCNRFFCTNTRSLEMKILDSFGIEVIHIHRPLACECCLYPCCLQKMEVSAPPGNVIGIIEQEWSIFPRSSHLSLRQPQYAGYLFFMLHSLFFTCCCLTVCNGFIGLHFKT